MFWTIYCSVAVPGKTNPIQFNVWSSVCVVLLLHMKAWGIQKRSGDVWMSQQHGCFPFLISRFLFFFCNLKPSSSPRSLFHLFELNWIQCIQSARCDAAPRSALHAEIVFPPSPLLSEDLILSPEQPRWDGGLQHSYRNHIHLSLDVQKRNKEKK